MPSHRLAICAAVEVMLTAGAWGLVNPPDQPGSECRCVGSAQATTPFHHHLSNAGSVRAPVPADLKAGEERAFEIAERVRVVFCWIPPGKAQLGSPKPERKAVLKSFKISDEPAWLVAEAEENRKLYTTKGFWLGKHEITQSEWESVMGSNPSSFNGKKPNKAKGADTKRFPVEMVSWNDCQEFIKKVNDRARTTMLLDKGVRFSLPTENEWEYAYRGGKGNKTPFYWGDVLSGKEANCHEDSYGTNAPTTYLDRPCTVEFTNNGDYKKHPWGLMHMSGNIVEWCSDECGRNERVLRGGSWKGAAVYCRGAARPTCEQDVATDGTGLRLCIVSN